MDINLRWKEFLWLNWLNNLGINNSMGVNLNASWSWWGSYYGPGGQGTGPGDNITTNVIPEPWYTDALMTNLSNQTAVAAAAAAAITTITPSGGGLTTTTTRTWSRTVNLPADEFADGATRVMKNNYRATFEVNGEDHQVGVTAVGANTITIEVSSEPQDATLAVGDERRFDVLDDGYYDLYVKLDKIDGNEATVTIKSIREKITEETTGEEEQKQTEAERLAAEAEEEGVGWIIAIAVIIVIIGVVLTIVMKKKRRK